MKKDILRVQNFNMKYSASLKLVDVSLCLMAGETVGFLGLDNSGKNLLVDILCGNEGYYQGFIFVDGKRIIHMEDIHKYVYKISISNFLIESWSVADYIYLLSESSTFGVYRRKDLIKRANLLIKKAGLDLDASKELKSLTELEKRLVDLVKAYNKEAKILVIEDNFEGCSPDEINKFKTALSNIMGDRMAAIIDSYSAQVLRILSDKYIIFKGGRIVKKCNKDYIRDNNHLEKFLLGSTFTTKKKVLDSYKNEQNSSSDIVYSVRNMILKNGKSRFDFYRGEVVSILDLDIYEEKHIFDMLSGRDIDRNMDIYLEQVYCSFNDITDFVKHKIVSVGNLGCRDELLLQMSIGDNLLIPSINKVSSLGYVFSRHKILKVLENEVQNNIMESTDNVRDMTANDYIVLLLERWYIYKPKVLILFEPFIHCDIFGISLVKSYIKKFTGIGTTVIIVKSRKEYAEDISDRIISIR
ncbi:MAG: ATP-binding cassette domain-containing protein [Hungateiclostridium thermocellum]|nr:ATP-binding cassette domain-containing protein [Acetivibrio thermocellus]